jgi:hypothetical protein
MKATFVLAVALVTSIALVTSTDKCDCLLRQFNHQICDKLIADQDTSLQSRLFSRKITENDTSLLFCKKLRTDIQNGVASIDAFLAQTSVFQKVAKNELSAYSECHICWNDHDKTSLKSVNCGHVFHSACLKQCIKSRPPMLRTECPTCRHDYLDKPKGHVWNPQVAKELDITTSSFDDNIDPVSKDAFLKVKNRGIFGCIKSLSNALCCTSIDDDD